ncbi:MAG: succinyl-diaminopimelate desuccinylase [Acidimicrobiales bacterium]|nr:succinyl-diaminopimelate desuccinylase [Acidimicrobiales bacterium]MCB9372098.1 succinyl-diaminopimelate desuccinylase [Microthrixaceae bacterium]
MTGPRPRPPHDLLALTAELVDIPSVSRDEAAITAHLEHELRALGHLDLTRVGDNLVARTELGRPSRLVLAGHTDTVPAAGNERARIEGDTLWGLGAADMKGGLAVMLELARTMPSPAVDVTYVFYAREEIDASASGLGELFAARPDLMVGDAAILGEPTAAAIEAGCQGTMHLRVDLAGRRAHSARPWMGRNAVHRLGALLAAVEARPERRPVLQGCEYREALQAVSVEGGVARNVVPDEASVTLNHRFAPDRTPDEAEAAVREVLAPVLDEGDRVERLEVADGAAPGLDHPLLAALAGRHDLEIRAKLGWTDVARFAAAGVPAVNLGPGDSTYAHRADEHVERDFLDATWFVLADLLERGV